MKVFIYTLSNPQTSQVYYVGVTKDVNGRYYSHCKRPRTPTGEALLVLGLKPEINVVEECDSRLQAERETFFIEKYSSLGYILENKEFTAKEVYSTRHNQELKKRILIDLSISSAEQLSIFAKEKNRTVKNLVQLIINKYLSNIKPAAK